MANSSRLRSNIRWSLGLAGVNYLFPLVVYMHVSRTLGVSGIGLVGFIDSITVYFILFSMMGVSMLGMREVAKGSRLSSTFWSILTLHAFFTLIVLAAMIAATFAVPELRANSRFMCIGMCKLVFNVLLVEWFYAGMERFRFIALRTILVKCVYLVAVFIFVRRQDDTLTYYMLTMLVVAATAAVNMRCARRIAPLSDCHDLFKTMQTYISPFFLIGFYALASASTVNLCMAWIGFQAGDEAAGIFSTASRIVIMVIALFRAYNDVVAARASILWNKGQISAFRSLSRRSIIITATASVTMAITLWFLAPLAIEFMSGSEFELAASPLRTAALFIVPVTIGRLITEQVIIPSGQNRISALSAAAGLLTCILILTFLPANNYFITANWPVCAIIGWLGGDTIAAVFSLILLRRNSI